MTISEGSMAGNKWQISDELWEKMAPLLPEHKTHHPLGALLQIVGGDKLIIPFC